MSNCNPDCQTTLIIYCEVSAPYRTIDNQKLTLFYRLSRTACLYNGCLAWYNVVLLTSRVHSGVKCSQQSQLRTRATVE